MRKLGLTMRVDAARERRDALDQSWYALALALDYEPVILPNLPDPQVLARQVETAALAGVILTGGNDLSQLPGATGTAPERDACERAVLRVCAERRIPVLGVCRGAQHLVTYFGGNLRPVEGHVGGAHAITVRDPEPMPLTARDAVNSFHNWGAALDDLPPSLRAVAMAPDGTVEAFVHRDFPQWGIFWHPEREPRDNRDAQILQTLFG